MDIFLQIFFLLLAYLVGSIPFAYVIGKMKGIDIREHGSKNVGATNAARILGKRFFFYIYTLDALKGALFVALFRYDILPQEWCLLSPMLYGFSACLGHTFPIFLKFKGGKAVSSSSGAAGIYYPWALLIGISIFALVVIISKYVSLGSLIATTCFLISTVFFSIYSGEILSNLFTAPNPSDFWPLNLWYPLFTAFMATLIFLRHRANIYRLTRNQETKIDL